VGREPPGTAVILTALPEPPLSRGSAYDLMLAPHEIVMLRLAVDGPPGLDVPPLTTFRPLVPEARRASLTTRHVEDGHPPEDGSGGP